VESEQTWKEEEGELREVGDGKEVLKSMVRLSLINGKKVNEG